MYKIFCVNICFHFTWVYYLGVQLLGSHGNLMFNFLKNCKTVFQSSCAILRSNQQCMGIPVPPHSHQNLLLTAFFDDAILICVKWYRIVVLFCISLVVKDVEHLLMCLLTICIYSLKKCLFKSFAHLKTGLFIFYCWVVRILYIFWFLGPSQIHDLQILSLILSIVFSHFW